MNFDLLYNFVIVAITAEIALELANKVVLLFR